MIEIFVSDIHYPFEDPFAERLALKIMKAVQPDLLVLGGDIVDCYDVSRFVKDPARRGSLPEEIAYARARLALWVRWAKRTVMMEGNHENRLPRYLWTTAPAISKMLTIPHELGLHDLGVEWRPLGQPWKVGDLIHIHGSEVGVGSTYVARNMFNRSAGNVIFGHHHVFQMYLHARARQRELFGAWANGCLCKLDPEYVLWPNWQQGLTIVEYSGKGYFHVDQIPFFSTSAATHLYATFGSQTFSVPLKGE
jgi:predicted phosphodiesterase